MPEGIAPDDSAELPRTFLESRGKIEGHARRRFHYLHCGDLEEAITETVALVLVTYPSLLTQGRAIEGKRGAVGSSQPRASRQVAGLRDSTSS